MESPRDADLQRRTSRFALTLSRFIAICAEGFYQVVRLAAGSLFYAAAGAVRGDQPREKIQLLAARCLTAFFRNLGATFIKIGQVLSSRPDVLPPYMIAELQKLQDQVPPFRFEEAVATIESDLGRPIDEVFDQFEAEPIAAASVAQVHEAHLNDGTHVAVKVQRPNIAATMERDLTIIRALARPLDLFPGVSNIGAARMAGEFSKAIHAQLDFPLEVRNNRRFDKQFAEMPFVRVPHIYEDLCGPHLITMEFIKGKKLTEVMDDPPIDKAIMADRMLEIYLAMAFKHFFLHADLHPGNILIDDDGNFILLDTGLVYEPPAHYVRRFFRVYMAMFTRNGSLILDVYLEDVDVPEDRLAAARVEVDELIVKYDGLSASEIEIGQALMEVFGVLRRNHIYLDPEWTGFFLSEITFEGISKMLDSTVDIINAIPAKLPKYVPHLDFINADDPVVIELQARLEEDARQAAALRDEENRGSALAEGSVGAG